MAAGPRRAVTISRSFLFCSRVSWSSPSETEARTVAAPTSVEIPANVPHAFRNRSDRFVHRLCLCAPVSQEEFFAAIGNALDRPDTSSTFLNAAAAAEKDGPDPQACTRLPDRILGARSVSIEFAIAHVRFGACGRRRATPDLGRYQPVRPPFRKSESWQCVSVRSWRILVPYPVPASFNKRSFAGTVRVSFDAETPALGSAVPEKRSFNLRSPVRLSRGLWEQTSSSGTLGCSPSTRSQSSSSMR